MSTSETACLACALQHNDTVRFLLNVCVIAALSVLVGCSSPNQHGSTAPVWEDLNTVVQPSPVFPIAGPVESDSAPIIKPKAPSAAVAPTVETWIPLQRWIRASGAGTLVRLTSGPQAAYTLQTTNGAFQLHTGSQLAHWDGTDVRLGFAPQLIDGQPYVHSLDLVKTIQPVLFAAPAPSLHAGSVIVIDPGHGGENAGTKSVLGNRYEKEFTLDWALRLQGLLQANNYKVFLTRSNDSDLALSNRVAFAAQHRADLFISLHFNSAGPNDNEAGLETYCLTPMGMPSSLTRGFPDEVRQNFPNNAFDIPNLMLALRVHRSLLEVNGHHDRGIRRARFPGVLRGQQRAAILVEGGYLSNPQEARLIGDPGYRQHLAEAVARALLPGGNSANSVVFNGPSTLLKTAPAASIITETAEKTASEALPENRVQ